ncbi:hypothetical protein [Leifsonia sp. NPDC077715]|uniref:hypothetical protein n=1 Tax=Leifsonia sp. NPDC077715 TaxID=3155539 RepID=UPI00342BE090
MADQLAVLGRHELLLDEYLQVMREDSARFEEAGIGMGERNDFVQKGLAARREVESSVRRVVQEQSEALEDAAREIRRVSEAEVERLHQEGNR